MTSTSGITVERRGRRSYIVGNTYAVKSELRAAGAHWDGDEKAWWLGSDAAARELVDSLTPKSEADAETQRAKRAAEMLERDRSHILGRATYQGHSYYLVGEGSGARGPWARLLFRDGSKTFFAARADVSVEKRYLEPMTLRGLQDFAARKQTERQTGECSCRCHHGGMGRMGSTGSALFDGCDYCGCEEDG